MGSNVGTVCKDWCKLKATNNGVGPDCSYICSVGYSDKKCKVSLTSGCNDKWDSDWAMWKGTVSKDTGLCYA